MQVTSHGAGPFDFLLQANTSTTDEVFTLTNNGNVSAIINTVTIVGRGPIHNFGRRLYDQLSNRCLQQPVM